MINRRIFLATLPLLGTAWGLGVIAAERPSGRSLVHTYNEQPMGDSVWQRLSLRLLERQNVVRNYQVLKLWRWIGKEVRTLYILEGHAGLRGTVYMVIERLGPPVSVEMYLSIPAGEHRILHLHSSQHGDRLLGSDFALMDLQWWISETDLDFELVLDTHFQQFPVWIVNATLKHAKTGGYWGYWKRLRLSILKDCRYIVQKEFFRDTDSDDAERWLRVDGLAESRGVLTATKVSAGGRGAEGSDIILLDQGWSSRAFPEDWFEPGSLNSLSKHVSQGGILIPYTATRTR